MFPEFQLSCPEKVRLERFTCQIYSSSEGDVTSVLFFAKGRFPVNRFQCYDSAAASFVWSLAQADLIEIDQLSGRP